MFNTLRRRGRTVYDSFYCRSFPDKKTLGKLNQWTIRTSGLNADSVIYSGGAGGDISFELELVKRFGCKVFLFDPSHLGASTVKALDHLPEAQRIQFSPLALAGRSGEIAMSVGGNHDGLNWFKVGEGTPMVSTTIDEFMRSHSHRRIDLLKLDIEGFEYDVLEDCLSRQIEISQICLEFHHFFKDISRFRTYSLMRKLRRAGFKLIHKHMYDHTLIKGA